MIHIIKSLLNAIIPLPCACCQKQKEDVFENGFCNECKKQLPFHVGFLCPMCGGILDSACEICCSCLKQPTRPWSQAISLFQHKDLIRVLIHQFKYRNRTELGRIFGEMLAQKLISLDEKPDYIVPISMPLIRKLLRGYNQSEILSKYASKQCGIPILNALKRPIWLRSQTRKGKLQRFKQLKDAFVCCTPKMVQGKHLLLVDDVFTTGATLHVATETLLEVGARKISVITLSRR